MFGVDSGELLLIVLVAVVVIGPKDLPRVMRTVGHWVGKARGMADQFRMGMDQMVRDSEIAELEKKWREQNDAIMKAHPMAPAEPGVAPPAPPPLAEPADSGWGPSLDKDDAAAAPVMKPLHRVAPPPPVGSLPAKPVRPRLDKDAAAPAQPILSAGGAAPPPPDPAKAPAPTVSGRRPPRSAPQAKMP